MVVARYTAGRQLFHWVPPCPLLQQWRSHCKRWSELAVGKQGERSLHTGWSLFLWHAVRRLRETYKQLPGRKCFRKGGDLWQSQYVPVKPANGLGPPQHSRANTRPLINILSFVHVHATNYCLSNIPEQPYRWNITNFSFSPAIFRRVRKTAKRDY